MFRHSPSALLLIFLTGFCPVTTFAQKEAYNWFFGEKAGISFTTLIPSSLPGSGMITTEGCSSMSNSNGDLLFYTDGVSVWNKDHVKMPDGTGLYGNASSTHSSVVVKKPGSSSEYYIFTSDAFETTVNKRGVNYSLVNMQLDGGKGNISVKNATLPGLNIQSNEQIAATLHSNKIDAWIAVVDGVNRNLYIYVLSSAGLAPPTIFPLPEVVEPRGQVKFSGDGRMFAIAGQTGNSFLMDFDPQTGQVSAIRKLSRGGISAQSVYGLEFSPSNNFIYFAQRQHNKIYQCPVPAGDIVIADACTQISKDTLSSERLGQMQLGPDRKIYISRNGYEEIGCIRDPDKSGFASDYENEEIILSPGKCGEGLPTFMQSYITSYSIISRDSCPGDITRFSLLNFTGDSILWDFGDLSTQWTTADSVMHQYAAPGIYQVKATVHLMTNTTDVLHEVSIIDVPVPSLGNDTLVCSNAVLRPDVALSGYSQVWSTLDTTGSIEIATPDTFWVTRKKSGCIASDTFIVTHKYAPSVSIPDALQCNTETLTITSNDDGDKRVWSTGDTTQSTSINSPGSYIITAGKNGCFTSDTFGIRQLFTPVIFPVNDTLLCEGPQLRLQAPEDPSFSYQWNTGDTSAAISVTRTGIFMIKVTNDCGAADDTISITFEDCSCKVFMPGAFSPNEDRINDQFKGISQCAMTTFNLSIFNRWGQKVFETQDIAEGWDGKLDGVICLPDVYLWKVTYLSYNMNKPLSLKGTVTLIR